MIEYRQEIKYMVSRKQISIIEERLNTLMDQDPHHPHGGYSIRSIYFDTPDDYFLRQVAAGYEDHTKYRIRIYNQSDRLIRVEKKLSYIGKKKKMVDEIDRNTCNCILSKFNLWRGEFSKTGVVDELCRNVYAGQLVPKVIVEYKRIAFVAPFGNIRITLDESISASKQFDRFFDGKIDSVSIIPHYGILEIKFDAFFPGYIVSLFQDLSLERVSFSKYQIGREKIGCWR